MQTERKELENREVQLTIKLDAGSTKKYREQAAKRLGQHVKVKGFRPGKAPVETVAQTVGEGLFMQEVLDLAIPQAYFESIKKEKLEPVARPKVEVKGMEPIEFVATVALMPEVKLKKLDKLKIKRESIKVEKEELEGTIYEFQKYLSTYKDVDREAKKGDRVEIDFEGFDEDSKPLDNTKSKNHPLIIGDNTFVPGFEDNLIGMKIGDKKEFQVTFPKDYHRDDFQNKKVTFKVELKRLEEMELAKIDKEFSKKILHKELDEKEFRAEIEADIKRQKEVKEDQRQQGELFEKFLDHADLKMSDLLIEEEIDHLLHQQKHELEHRGIKWEDFMAMYQEKGKDIRAERREEAEKRVKVRFIIREVIQAEKLEVTDADMKAELKARNIPAKEMKKDSPQYNQLKDQLMLEKVFALYIEPAKEKASK